MKAECGKVVWLTGLSGCGKSTLAWRLKSDLEARQIACAVVDGDDVRQVVNDEACGHDRKSRLVNAYRICRLARLLAGQGLVVLVATMSLYHEIHRWNRRNFLNYLEVFLETDLTTLRRRDPKGLYRRVAAKTERNLSGVDIAAEFPVNADLHIVNNGGSEDIPAVCATILERILSQSNG